MISRVVFRSLQNPALRTTSATYRIASSTTVWNRSMARNSRSNNHQNHNNPNQKKPTDYPRSSQLSGASEAFKGSQHGARSSDKFIKPDYSNSQDEISKGVSPQRNTTFQSEGTGGGSPNSASRRGEGPAFSGSRPELKHASPSENNAPETDSTSATGAEHSQPSGPLPDLTKGIPSTLEYEMSGKSPLSAVDLTEADSSGSGRGKGELPASAYISSSDKKRARAANIMYAFFAAFSITGVIYLGRNWENDEEEAKHKEEAPSGWSLGLMWKRARARMGDQLSYYHEPAFQKLLPDEDPIFARPYTLVLSLDDLLLHSEWTREHGWRMAKRPGLDYFLRYLSQYYELCLFTSQPWAMADPVYRKLDPFRIISWPLYREATHYENGEYIKKQDLSYLNRPLNRVIIMDTNPAHTSKQPENAIILPKWKGDKDDKELVAMIPFLEFIATMDVKDVRTAIKSFEGAHIPTEFARRDALQRKKFAAQVAEEQKRKPKANGLGFLSSALGLKMQGQDGEQTLSEGMAQGKTLQDQHRERAMKNYLALEKEIRENGEKWLKEEQMNEEKMKEESMKMMKSGFTGFFGADGEKK
ncbi:hypothetical protein B0O99DRAFT_717294 [Bisporella sp. PMI_857]|nr:hypothetical protein B0O99DRAFT_717294 [Bisporella sp. PMI_857]